MANRRVRVPRDADGNPMHRAMGVPILINNVKLGTTSFVDILNLKNYNDRVFIGLMISNPSSAANIEIAFGEEGVNTSSIVCTTASNIVFDNLTFGGVVDDSTGKHCKVLRARVTIPQGLTSTGSIIYSGNPTDGQTIQVGTKIYEFSDDRSPKPGHIRVDIGITEDVSWTNFAAQLNDHEQALAATLDAATNTVEVQSLYGGDYLETTTPLLFSDGPNPTGVTFVQLNGGTGGVVPIIHLW